MQTETERLRTITLAVPADEAGRLFIQALHHLVPTALDTGGTRSSSDPRPQTERSR